MLLKLTLERGGSAAGDDLLIDADAVTTVGSLAMAIGERDPNRGGHPPQGAMTIRVESPGSTRVLDPEVALGDADLASGDRISLAPASGQFLDGNDQRAAAASLVVASGPDEGMRIQLRSGSNQLGRDRDNDIVLTDPMVSKRHARLNVTDVVEVLDLGSVNGVFVSGEPVERAILRPGDQVLFGDSSLVVESVRRSSLDAGGPHVAFNRSPYLDPVYEGPELKAPEPPSPPNPTRFPVLMMIGPLIFGVVMYAFTRQLISVIFMGLSPMMMIGMFLEGKRSSRQAIKEGSANFRAALAQLDDTLRRSQAEEVARRRLEHPATSQVVGAGTGRAPMLWARRPDRHSFLELRLGLATQPTRAKVEMPGTNRTIPELWAELQATVAARSMVDDVPIVGALPSVGTVGVAGSRHDALGAARALVAQVTGLHSPAEVVLGALLPSAGATDWDWIKWLPHTTSEHSPIDAPLVAVGPQAAPGLVAALRDLIVQRSADEGPGDDPPRLPAVVVLIENDVPVDRSLLIEMIENGPAVGVYSIWVAPTIDLLPAAAEAFLGHDPATQQAIAGYIDGGRSVTPVSSEPLEGAAALAFARSLAPVVDAGARSDESSDIPARVSFLDQVGMEIADSPAAVIDRWRLSDSLPAPELVGRRRKRAAPLQALVGAGAHGPLQLDLRSHGPHALVGGTTGAGKSEFLQSWILGLAVNHSPHRVTFLFVDYKGGAAFSECIHLPHTVGLVTDLTPHLVQRALTSLNAELRHREHILNRKKAKDVLELERLHDPETPPSLVIVVDEFAALVAEVPEFVDGVVNVAQRGRSLGLHLVLATQRPAGVIKDNLRANTNLRVALRMADEADSDDVVGTDLAAGFSPDIPGRGIAKLGPGRLNQFQAAYVGGWTTGEPPPPRLVISSFVVGAVTEWPEPEQLVVEGEDPGPNDLVRVVATTGRAATDAGLPAPRRPWLPELAHTYNLGRNPTSDEDLRLISRTDQQLVFGVADDPENQSQVPIAFHPDSDGNMAVIGTGGSGKSAFLRTLTVAASLSTRGGPCHVYGMDFASRGLDMLEVLPNVGAIINGDDEERVIRLLRWVRELIDERLARYAAVNADSITQYRAKADRPDEARILLLVDGFPAFRQEYEGSGRLAHYDRFHSIAAEGRQAGVHVVVSADRVGAVPSALSSVIQRRLVLRLAGENEYAMAAVPMDAFPPGTPPGRGFTDDQEVQVAVLGGDPDTSRQAAALRRLADLAVQAGAEPAPDVRRLPQEVRLADLPPSVDGLPAIGIADQDLEPIAVSLESPFLVVGPPKSGKTTSLLTLIEAVQRTTPAGAHLIYVGDDRSPLASALDWDTQLVAGGDLAPIIEGIAERWTATPRVEDAERAVMVVDDVVRVGGWLESERLGELAQALVRAGHVVMADGETDAMGGGWGLVQVLKAARTGLVLVPDQYDGDSVFKTPFPKVSRADFPPGRGFYVTSGRAFKLQVALPSMGGT